MALHLKPALTGGRGLREPRHHGAHVLDVASVEAPQAPSRIGAGTWRAAPRPICSPAEGVRRNVGRSVGRPTKRGATSEPCRPGKSTTTGAILQTCPSRRRAPQQQPAELTFLKRWPQVRLLPGAPPYDFFSASPSLVAPVAPEV